MSGERVMSLPYVAGEPLSCRQIRELDRLAIEQIGVPGVVLMENAARSVAEFIYSLLPNPARARVLLLCGPGNNGGDGLAAARHLSNAGVTVAVALAAPPERCKGDAATNLAIYQHLGGTLIDASTPGEMGHVRQEAAVAEVIVDGLLGTGSKGAPQGTMAELIEIANAAPRARRVAIDIPSGLDADSGEVGEPCFRADATVTFVAEKVGFRAAAARTVLGRVLVVGIGVPRELSCRVQSSKRKVTSGK
jgi:hydroxyethylthiazole kinase-like uncharacterized protein yjeF